MALEVCCKAHSVLWYLVLQGDDEDIGVLDGIIAITMKSSPKFWATSSFRS